MSFAQKRKKAIYQSLDSENGFSRILSSRYQWPLFYAVLIATDFLMVGLAFRFAFWVRFELGINFFDPNAVNSPIYYQGLVWYIIPIWLGLFFVHGLYRKQYLFGGIQEYSRLFFVNTIATILVIAAGFFQPSLVFARGWILISWFSAFFYTALGRFTLRRVVYYLRARGWFLSNAIIIGINDEAKTMAEQLRYTRNSGLNLIGFIDFSEEAGKEVYKKLACLGNLDVIPELIRNRQVKELILTSSALTREQILEIFQKYGVSTEANLHLSSGLYEIITTGLRVKEFAWVPLIGVNKVRLTGANRVFKAILDYGITIPGLIIISPLLLLITLIIRLDSPGPVIHRRLVLGVNGKPFHAFKFRTMHINGDEILEKHPDKLRELNKEHKIKDDPRITRFGAILRKTSLDELPQLFNVLRNEMSLVGPRMISPEEVQEYRKWGLNLLTVKPGITGKWQVSGRSDITYQQRVQMDMYYIRNWNIWLDIQLLFQTIPAVMSKRGAY